MSFHQKDTALNVYSKTCLKGASIARTLMGIKAITTSATLLIPFHHQVAGGSSVILSPPHCPMQRMAAKGRHLTSFSFYLIKH